MSAITSPPSKLSLSSTTKCSLHDRFTKLAKAPKPSSNDNNDSSDRQRGMSNASQQSRKLAMQMSQRPSVQAALKLKKKSIVDSNSRQQGIKGGNGGGSRASDRNGGQIGRVGGGGGRNSGSRMDGGGSGRIQSSDNSSGRDGRGGQRQQQQQDNPQSPRQGLNGRLSGGKVPGSRNESRNNGGGGGRFDSSRLTVGAAGAPFKKTMGLKKRLSGGNVGAQGLNSRIKRVGQQQSAGAGGVGKFNNKAVNRSPNKKGLVTKSPGAKMQPKFKQKRLGSSNTTGQTLKGKKKMTIGDNTKGSGKGGKGEKKEKPKDKGTLDMDLDTYMAKSKGHLDNDLDAYMSQTSVATPIVTPAGAAAIPTPATVITPVTNLVETPAVTAMQS